MLSAVHDSIDKQVVRSYEPTVIDTEIGKVYNGVVRNETASEVFLQIDAQKTVRIARDEIEIRKLGKTSIMPAGLDKHFTPQQLADLIVFLKASK
jgi:putative heme-binding domain-containing protein